MGLLRVVQNVGSHSPSKGGRLALGLLWAYGTLVIYVSFPHISSSQAECGRTGVMGPRVGMRILKVCLLMTFWFLDHITISHFHSTNLFRKCFRGSKGSAIGL